MRLIIIVALASGCSPTSYTFSPTVKRSTPRGAGCEFTVLAASPDEAFEEIGTMKHYNGDVPTQESELKKVIAERVCEVGGHAVIAPRTSAGYPTATVIRYSKGYHR